LPEPTPFRNWFFALILCGAAAVLCIRYVDRPVADYAHDHLLQTFTVGLLNDVLTGLGAVAALGFLALITAGCLKLAHRTLPRWAEIPILCSWAMMWSMSSAEALKRVFGRADPEAWTGATPQDLHRSIYGFQLLRSGYQFESFPSATMSVSAAVLAILWIAVPRLRPLWALLFSLIGIALVATNSHFISDVIAGALLGSFLGVLTVRLLLKQPLDAV
jgi:membrane-associated phospholipid phosphatase